MPTRRMLAGAVEATVLVVRAGKTTVDEVTAAMESSARGRWQCRGHGSDRRPRLASLRAAARAYQAKVSEAS